MAKRYASIDFMRGLAIWMMVFLHTLMRWVDKGAVIKTIGDQQLFIVFILLSAVFFAATLLITAASSSRVATSSRIAKIPLAIISTFFLLF